MRRPLVRHPSSTLLLTSTLLACVLVACGGRDPSGAATTAGAEDQLYLDFETGDPVGSVLTGLANAGTAPVEVSVAAVSGGAITSATRRGEGRSARFPSYTGASPGPTAVVVVRPDGQDRLDPGDESFTYGGDVRLDPVSSGTETDDGDNVVQRGGYASTGQFKLQLDHGVPSCRVAGDDGVLFVRASHEVERGAWYTLTCRRTDERLRLTLQRRSTGTTESWRRSGSTGHLTVADLPLSVGGKLTEAGRPAESADQLNGWLDDVFVAID